MPQLTPVLFLAYFFPPIGGAGVQRTVKFVKYLPAFMYDPVVVTSPGRTADRTTPPDPTLGAELPASIRALRVDGPEPPTQPRAVRLWRSLLGLPHPFAKWWVRSAVSCGVQVCAANPVKLIYATLSPYESALAATRLSKETGLPWIADLRDPWALDDMAIFTSCVQRMHGFRQMRAWLGTASTIVMNTPEAARVLVEAFPDLAGKRVVTITNGYDAEDFSGAAPTREDGKFRIVHCGYFQTEMGFSLRRNGFLYRCLGGTRRKVDVLPRSHVFLLKALEMWSALDADGFRDVEVVFVGASSETDRSTVADSAVSGRVRFTGYLSHGKTLEYLRSADLTFLPLYSLPAGERARTVPGKTYEYMASGRPILGAVPEGDAKDFLDQCGTAFTCRPDDCESMLRVLRRVHAAWRKRERIVSCNADFVRRFERSRLTEQLAAEFDRVLSRRGSVKAQSGG